ncbi:(d)CMP kinase [Gammaproteobacteria bacterium]|nr:(d)CMP kinase [Gammaproteobacteria bacterium]MDA8957323.1 (d)CMP kinase [Gammaproteobacteria bacterium]
MDKIITIDGPSASGKGSLTRSIAAEFNFNILDSGLLYRAYAYFYEKEVNLNNIGKRISGLSFSFNTDDVQIFDNSEEITSLLRSENTAKVASALSSKKETRTNLLDIQRSFYNGKGLVADGRDMGTVVFPNARLKIFLTASSEVRAKRRHIELQNRGQEVNMRDLIEDIEERDLRDRTRTLSPLIPAEDSVVIDSSLMSLDEVLSFTKKLAKKEFDK